jgi:hypothetical protein
MIIKKQILSLAIAVIVLGITVGLAQSINAAPYMHSGSAKAGTYGTIASIQSGGDTTHPTWILSGHWGTNIINKTRF